ncbi:uncharacterized protein LOC126587451 [Malus sylvestris]|uniref:uncharacterized protein LOC126587451 n=1 Tax=Malus sylvestris TaxID=3752 RepID=UPI0021ABA883|nr:uncharacterized protein LOC126587451 [Malus sylvestris]
MVAGTNTDKGKALVLDQDSSHSVEFGSSSGINDQPYKNNGGGSRSPGYNSGGQYYTNGSPSSNFGSNPQSSYHYGGYKGNNFRGKGRGRSYQSGSRSYNHSPNPSPGILGAPRPFQSHCPDHPSEIPTCQICNKKGHVAADCFQRHSTPVSASHSPIQCQICWKFGHSAIQCYHRGNFAYQGRPLTPNLSAMHVQHQPSAPEEQFWVADTGATSHMTSDLANLELAQPYHGNDTITTASGAGQIHRENPSQGAVYGWLLSYTFPHYSEAAICIISVSQMLSCTTC